MARRLRPRLIVLDIRLPKRDGWQVLTELKSDPDTATIPVVIVTVTEDRQPASALGVQEFFIKPMDRSQFLGRLRQVRPELFLTDRSRSILLLDDEPIARTLIGDMLRAEGFVVREVVDGETALQEMRQDRPDAVVLDVVMPGLDGFAVIDAIRANPEWQQVPILVITDKNLTVEDQERINGSIQALMAKHLLTPDRLQQHLREMGLLDANR
jgi:CheY-like chemotaxis protein